MTDRQIADYIFCFMEQLNEVEVTLGIPAQAIENLPKSFTEKISFLIKYFGQCKRLMQKDPEKYYMWLQTHALGGHQANYIQIERKYCQMIFLVKMVYQKAGLYDEFRYAVAKGNEWLNLWKQTLKDND